MQVTDKLTKALTEAKYLNADNVSRYRCIMRIFFENYEKLRYWLYQEDVYAQMIQDPFFADYKPEQCQQDLAMLVEWKNLNTIQDTRKVSSIEEFNNYFVRLNQNYQDYIRDLNSVKAEEMMHTKQFLVFKDRLVEYLRNFIKGLQRNVGVIEEDLRMPDAEVKLQVFEKIIQYELLIPRMAVEVSRELIEEKTNGRYQSIYDWFVSANGEENEAGKLFDATNEIIRRITRYAAQLSEKNAFGANRREEYRKVAELFLKCDDVQQAHRMSAMVFGIERPYHLKGDLVRETDSMNLGVYEEQPFSVMLKPRVRTYREKSSRSAIRESAEEKQKTRQRMMEQQKEDAKKLRELERDGRIDFDGLPVIEAHVREILLKWLSDAMEDPAGAARTEDGRRYVLDMSRKKERCVIHCEDGNFTMPKLAIVFQEEA